MDTNKENAKDVEKQVKSNLGCFIQNGSHPAIDCPKQERRNALVTEEGQDRLDAEILTRVNALQLRLNCSS